MTWLIEQAFHLLGLFLLLAFCMALLSPLESLGWWAGWTKRHMEPEDREVGIAPSKRDGRAAGYYVVYFTGVIGFEGGAGGKRELGLLENIAARLPADAVLVDDVFPYSVSNNPLNGERLFSKAWQWLDDNRRRFKNPATPFAWLIILRNVFQVAVSADPRYGPLNNAGVAQEIVQSLVRHGYPVASQKPVYVVGYSGGAQIAVGVAHYLSKALQAPIRVVSIGGFLTDDPSIAHVDHVYHLQGSKDFFPRVAGVLYPGRWPIMAHSAWNRARRQAKITTIAAGPMAHFGRTDYFSRSTLLDDGQSHSERTADLVANAIAGTAGAVIEGELVSLRPSQ